MQQKRKAKLISVIMIQIVAIYCGLLFWSLKFHSQTSAAYNDIEHASFQITADWSSKDKGKHDKSSLSFIKQEIHCHSGLISAVIRNAPQSNSMKNSAVYEVYWSDKGNPKPEYGGQKVHSGTVPALRAGETYTISVKATKSGQYVFKVRHFGHDVWSETLKVEKKCIKQPKPPKGKHQSSISTEEPVPEKPITPESSPSQTETKEIHESSEINDEVQTEEEEELDETSDTLD